MGGSDKHRTLKAKSVDVLLKFLKSILARLLAVMDERLVWHGLPIVKNQASFLII